MKKEVEINGKRLRIENDRIIKYSKIIKVFAGIVISFTGFFCALLSMPQFADNTFVSNFPQIIILIAAGAALSEIISIFFLNAGETYKSNETTATRTIQLDLFYIALVLSGIGFGLFISAWVLFEMI